jgi:hypothetical protein
VSSLRWSELLVGVLAVLVGCGSDAAPAAPGGSGGAGGATAPESGAREGACPAGQWLDDADNCHAAGVAPSGCAAGFEHDGDVSCTPVQPDNPCAVGQLAALGETSCRSIGPCGSGTWGDIPVDGAAVHVDAGYTGGANDGSAAAPYTSVQAAVDAAADGALVAIAAGNYAESVNVEGKHLTLWGVCAEQVSIEGNADAPALQLGSGAGQSVVRGMALSAGSLGLVILEAEGVLAEQLWVHNTGGVGVAVTGGGSATLRDSLVELARTVGVFAGGATLTMERAEVRATLPTASDLTVGWGVVAAVANTGVPADLTMVDSIVRGSRDFGVVVQGSTAELDGVWIYDTSPKVPDDANGGGIYALDGGGRSTLTVRRSVIEQAFFFGMTIQNSVALIEDTVVRNIAPQLSDDWLGIGINLVDAAIDSERAELTLERSTVLEAHGYGVLTQGGSDARLSGLVVRDTKPHLGGSVAGRGVGAEVDFNVPEQPTLEIAGSLFERNTESGVVFLGSVGSVRDTLIRDTFALGGQFGWGLLAQLEPVSELRPAVEGEHLLIEGSSEVGVAVVVADLTLRDTTVRDTKVSGDGLSFGDGVLVAAGFDGRQVAPASLSADHLSIETSARAAVSAFGTSVALADSHIECNTIDLNGELYQPESNVAEAASFDDQGGNICGCAGEARSCKVLSSGLAPPKPPGGVLQ